MTNRTHLAVVRDDQEPEPVAPALDIATIDAVTRLMGQVERTARAQRPIVLHSAPLAATAPATRTGPNPIDVTIPPAPSSPAVPDQARARRLFTRAEVFCYCGMSILGSGTVGFALAHFGVNLTGSVPIIGGFWTLVSGIVIVCQDGRTGDAGDTRGSVKARGRR